MLARSRQPTGARAGADGVVVAVVAAMVAAMVAAVVIERAGGGGSGHVDGGSTR